MKIALLTPFYPYRGGIAQFSDRLYSELIKEHSIKVFSYSSLYPKFFFPGKTQFVPNPIDNPALPSERMLNTTSRKTYRQTADAINEYNPDVLVVAYWMPYVAIALGGVCGRLNKSIKVVGLVHNAKPHERAWLNKPLAMYFFDRCDAFVCMSEYVKKDLLKMGVKSPVLALEHPIYDHYPAKTDKLEAREQLAIDKNKKTLLFFGLIRAYKGLDLLIEAMGQLDDSYQLLIAGEAYGGFLPYQQLIDLSKNKDNIKVWDQYIPDDMVSLLFSAADALVLPYRSATQSGVVAIAYQMQTPVVATNVGALGRAVKRANTGLVAASVSAESIAKGIADFFEQDYTAKYSEGLKNEKARLSWSSFVQSVEPFISEL